MSPLLYIQSFGLDRIFGKQFHRLLKMASRLYTAKVREVLGDCDDETADTDIDV